MNLSEAILATLAYHDIFEYPLTLKEFHRYLIGKRAIFASVERNLFKLKANGQIGANQGYYFLKGRTKIVSIRKRRERYSRAKLKRAVFFASILKTIPTLKMVGISGALAMQNSHQGDDIDLVLLSSPNTLWTTRFLANTLLWPFKRDTQGKKIADRACLNFFMDESSLKIKDHNLYFAHEICQMKPLWDRDLVYEKFIKANSWAKRYLPNWQPTYAKRLTTNAKRKKKSSALVFKRSALVIENFLKSFQLWYMRSKITTEKTGKGQLFFHPVDTKKWIMEEFRKRLEAQGIRSSNSKSKSRGNN